MQKIVPFLWFDRQAEEAAKFYTSIFDDSKILSVSRYSEAGPGATGSVMSVTVRLQGREFTALNGGPHYSFTPAISFFVACRTEKEVNDLWRELSRDGRVFMELNRYPFSEKFGWVSDRHGLSWQLHLAGDEKKITPFFTFVGKQHGKAEEAMKSWVSQFKDSRISRLERYGPGAPQPEGTVMHGRFSLAGEEFMAMDSAGEHAFGFTPAISLFVNCETQEEVDEFWESLSAGGKKGQCGWLEDRYGVSWQIVPTILGELMQRKDARKTRQVMEALLKMTKLDTKELENAYEK